MRTKIIVVLIIIALLLSITQVYMNNFCITVGGIDYDWGKALIQTADSGFAVIGATSNFGAGYSDIFLTKFSSSGEFQWAKAAGTDGGDYGKSLIQTQDGGFVIAAERYHVWEGEDELSIMKFNASGDLEWAKELKGSKNEHCGSLIQTADGGYAVGGVTSSFSSEWGNFFIVKFSSDGELEWAKETGGTAIDIGKSLIQTTDGGYALAGATISLGSAPFDLLFIKFNSSGDVQWGKATGGPSYEEGYSIIQTTDAGFLMTGTTGSFGAGATDVCLVKYNSSGDLEWAKTAGAISYDEGHSVIQTIDDGFLITGITYNFGADSSDFLILKFNSSGDLEWAKTIGGNGFDWADAAIQITNGGFALTGRTESFGADSGDLFLAKLNQNGETCCAEDVTDDIIVNDIHELPTFSDVIVFPIANNVTPPLIDITDSIIITDVTPTLIKVCDSSIIQEHQHKLPLNNNKLSISPNPFPNSCEITFELKQANEISLKAFELSGKIVATLLAPTKVQKGKFSHIWQPNDNILNGIYIIRLSTPNKIFSKKVIKIKQ